MKRAALGLLALCGCNQIFGIKSTEPWDAGPGGIDGPVDALSPRLYLTWKQLQTAGANEVIAYPPIDGATVMFGKIGAPLTTAVVGTDGGFDIPYDLPNDVYRVVYQAPDVPVATEVHWTARSAHLVEPIWGRLPPRTAPPANSGIDFQPVSHVGGFTNAWVYTTGSWTATNVGATGSNDVVLPYSTTAVSLDRTLDTIDGATDTEIVADFDASHKAAGFAVEILPQLVAGTSQISPSTWETPTPVGVDTNWNDMAATRLQSSSVLGIGVLYTGPTIDTPISGVIPSATMPAFTRADTGALNPPMLLPLSTQTGVTEQIFTNPFDGVKAPLLPPAALRISSTSRTVSGVNLFSGFQELVTASGATVSYPAGIAENVTLNGVTLTGVIDGQAIAFGGKALIDLKFNVDMTPVDDCVATLYRLAASTLTPVQRFLIISVPAATPFQLDATLFEGSVTYALGIECRIGYPNAASGDYTTSAIPYSTATVFPATFTVTL